MSIKRSDTFKIPLFGRSVTIERALKPGYKSVLKYRVPNEDGRGVYEGLLRFEVLTENSLEYQILRRRRLPSIPGETEAGEGKPVILETDNIRYLIDRSWGGKALGNKGQLVDIYWESSELLGRDKER